MASCFMHLAVFFAYIPFAEMRRPLCYSSPRKHTAIWKGEPYERRGIESKVEGAVASEGFTATFEMDRVEG